MERNPNEDRNPAWDVPTVPIAGSDEPFRFATSIASAATTPSTPRRWVATLRRSRHSFSPSRPMRSSRSCRRRPVDVRYPLATKNYHHEIELVVAIGARGVRLAPEAAPTLIYGYAVGLDMTRRDLQIAMREIKRPWDVASRSRKRRRSAPIIARGAGRSPRARCHLARGQRRAQAKGDLADMIWDVPHMLHFLSQYYELLPGDLIFTGTPAGVGAVVAGDALVGRIEAWANCASGSSRPARRSHVVGRVRRARIQPSRRVSRSSAVVRALGC